MYGINKHLYNMAATQTHKGILANVFRNMFDTDQVDQLTTNMYRGVGSVWLHYITQAIT